MLAQIRFLASSPLVPFQALKNGPIFCRGQSFGEGLFGRPEILLDPGRFLFFCAFVIGRFR
jgi:hypothetical protein